MILARFIGRFTRLKLSAVAKFTFIMSPTVRPLVSTTSFTVSEASGSLMVKELLVRLVRFDINGSNQSLQPPAIRCAPTFFMTKTVPQIISLAPGSRG